MKKKIGPILCGAGVAFALAAIELSDVYPLVASAFGAFCAVAVLVAAVQFAADALRRSS